jgi:hypothetical protein
MDWWIGGLVEDGKEAVFRELFFSRITHHVSRDPLVPPLIYLDPP